MNQVASIALSGLQIEPLNKDRVHILCHIFAQNRKFGLKTECVGTFFR
jgi:hypothetical protein